MLLAGQVDPESLALQKMRELLRAPSAMWRNEGQRLAVMAALEYKDDVVAVLATGSGKTMIPFIPAALEEYSLTIYIAPLNSVLDMADQAADRQGLGYQVYAAGDSVKKGVSLLLVSADKATQPSFYEVLVDAERSARYERRRFVFDEAHIGYTDASFRSRLKRLNQLRSPFPAQMVIMSATIPPVMMATLLGHFDLIDSHTNVIRTCTDRPEISYAIDQREIESVEAAVDVAFAHFSRHRSRTQDRAIVYVRDARDGLRVKAKLCALASRETHFYYGGSAATQLSLQRQSQEEHSAIISAWESTTGSPFLVATSAYGSGVNNQAVRFVYHVREPVSVLSYVQETGRAGRAGQPSYAMIVRVSESDHYNENGAPYGLPPVPNSDAGGVKRMREIVKNARTGCIRAALTSFTDGVGVRCSELNMSCSRCAASGLKCGTLPNPPQKALLLSRAKNVTLSAIGKRAIQSQSHFREAHERALEVRRQNLGLEIAVSKYLSPSLKFFKGKCVPCLIRGNFHAQRHSTIFLCPALPTMPRVHGAETDFRRDYIEFRVIYRHNDGPNHRDPGWLCYKCHLYQGIGLEHEDRTLGRKEPCSEDDVLKSLAYSCFALPDVKDAAQRQFNVSWTDIGHYKSWLASSFVSNDGAELTNYQRLFAWGPEYVKSLMMAAEYKHAATLGFERGFRT